MTGRAARATSALLALVTLAAAPLPAYVPAPRDAMTATVRRYLGALRAQRYGAAFALLDDRERAYFGAASAYRSVYLADAFRLERAQLLGARGNAHARVYFVRERVAFLDHASDARREAEVTVPLGATQDRGVARIDDPGKPYRAYATDARAGEDGVQVAVKKLDFYPDRVDVVLTFVNRGSGFVTLLPYGRSVLRDDRGGIYHPLANRDWTVTDHQLFEGVPLAPRARYTGSMAFTAPRFAEPLRAWQLTLAPALRAGADAPFALTVAIARPH
ncbi:MAG TPA: hypothetical protein VMD91_11940 [Candidatus Sulfotelmatobacter sp.]|nr:hypothetical protein [Candidatus Sulfotelmatobacter sp.]